MAIAAYLYYTDVNGVLRFLAKAFGFRKFALKMLESGVSQRERAPAVGEAS